MEFVICRHGQLSPRQYVDIANLKDQHWPHGVSSQINWIQKNFEENDIHIILYRKGQAVAYASLNRITCTVDGKEEKLLGLGGVCVDKNSQKQGLGQKILEQVNRTIAPETGLLLCHKELTGFYGRCGWETVHFQAATVAGAPFAHCIMSLGKKYGNVNTFDIPKNF